MCSSIPKFLLVENFTFLLGQLKAFDDPAIRYVNQGEPQLRGGQRRIYRSDNHTNIFYDYARTARVDFQTVVDVTFGAKVVECDEWHVDHDEFQDPKLKEKYPKPVEPYVVRVTSRRTLLNHTAPRYYVSCTCMDFETTFKEELLAYGYTNGVMSKPATGKKKLAPAICKHIYTVITREYGDILKSEDGAIENANIEQEVIPAPAPTTVAPAMPKKVPGVKQAKPLKTEDEKKAEKKAAYEKDIRRALKFFSNSMPNGVEVYKNSRGGSNNNWKQYKFMVAKYFQGWVIVFTNPQLNPMRDKVKEKEMVPLIARTGKGLVPTGDAIIVYTKYFNKDELMNMIKTETRPIQQNQIDRVKKLNPKAVITEGLELETASLRSLLLEIC
jgi:hypothetical protein